jgi:hypothetical protein
LARVSRDMGNQESGVRSQESGGRTGDQSQGKGGREDAVLFDS